MKLVVNEVGELDGKYTYLSAWFFRPALTELEHYDECIYTWSLRIFPEQHDLLERGDIIEVEETDEGVCEFIKFCAQAEFKITEEEES